MGREAQGLCTIGPHTEAVKALLESTVLIVRGATLKRQFAISALSNVEVQGNALRFQCEGERVTLELGAEEAQKWLKKIMTPAPSLAAKLGIGAEAKAYVLGHADDAALAAALAGASTTRAIDAAVLIAITLDDSDLTEAIAQHAGMPCRAMWVVHLKGKAATLGDTAIRQRLRGSGYMDNKTTAVSDRFTATRYARR
jgi:hypothetical protein